MLTWFPSTALAPAVTPETRRRYFWFTGITPSLTDWTAFCVTEDSTTVHAMHNVKEQSRTRFYPHPALRWCVPRLQPLGCKILKLYGIHSSSPRICARCRTLSPSFYHHFDKTATFRVNWHHSPILPVSHCRFWNAPIPFSFGMVFFIVYNPSLPAA